MTARQQQYKAETKEQEIERRLEQLGDWQPTAETGATTMRLAIVKENPEPDDNIKVNLYDSSGNEQTSGSESDLDCYAFIISGDRLDQAMPRLSIGDQLLVTRLHDGTDVRWYFINPFIGARDKTFS